MIFKSNLSDDKIAELLEEGYERQRLAMGEGIRPWSALGPATRQRLLDLTRQHFDAVAAMIDERID